MADRKRQLPAGQRSQPNQEESLHDEITCPARLAAEFPRTSRADLVIDGPADNWREKENWREIFALRETVETMAAMEDITPCPVDWCDDASEHWWPHELDGSRESREHEGRTWSLVSPYAGGSTSSVSVVQREHADGQKDAAYVCVHADDGELMTRNDVSQLIAGLVQAAGIAFPDDGRFRNMASTENFPSGLAPTDETLTNW